MAVGIGVTLEVDWDADGNFANANSNVSGNVLTLDWSRGRDSASQLTGRATAGELEATLKNEDNLYNSFNSGGDLYGKILPGLAVRLRISSVADVVFPYTFPLTFSEQEPAWRGYLDSVSPSFLRDSGKELVLRATGSLARIAARETAEIVTSTSIRTGAAITLVINDADSSIPTDIDTGETTMTRWWTSAQPALDAVRAIEETEIGYVGESPDGEIVFESRQSRLKSPHTVSQGTFSDAVDATLTYADIVQLDPLSETYNTMNAIVQLYTVGSLAVLWTLAESGANSPPLLAGATKIFIAKFPSAASVTNASHVNAWTTTAATTDMLANAAADGTGTNLTSSITIGVAKYAESMEITLTNGSTTDAFITKLQARGTPVTADDPLKIVEQDATSQASFGKRTFPLEGPFIPSEQDARDYMKFLLSIHKDPMKMLSVTWDGNKDDTHKTKARELDISDRITVVASNRSGLGINTDFFIEYMRHSMDMEGRYSVTYECSDATAYGGFWVLDVGKLGASTRFAI
tara:strand:+ start:1668 stop:3230 length:1563 start_codon:yes stop_codon:yes gene_type:complete